MRSALAGIVGLLAAAVGPAAAQNFAPLGTVMLFRPGSAEITPEARDALLASCARRGRPSSAAIA